MDNEEYSNSIEKLYFEGEGNTDSSRFLFTEGDNSNFDDNSISNVYTTEVVLTDSQYNIFLNHFTLINNLLVIQVMFLFLLFIYLFIHFTLERRKC